MQNKFKDRLVEARKKKGLSQEALGHEIGSRQEEISNYERGISTPGIEKLLLLAAALEVSTDYLTGYI